MGKTLKLNNEFNFINPTLSESRQSNAEERNDTIFTKIDQMNENIVSIIGYKMMKAMKYKNKSIFDVKLSDTSEDEKDQDSEVSKNKRKKRNEEYNEINESTIYGLGYLPDEIDKMKEKDIDPFTGYKKRSFGINKEENEDPYEEENKDNCKITIRF